METIAQNIHNDYFMCKHLIEQNVPQLSRAIPPHTYIGLTGRS